jgi:hypothetical protein
MNNPLATFKNFITETATARVSLRREQDYITQQMGEWAEMLKAKTIENRCPHLMINRARKILSSTDDWYEENYDQLNTFTNTRAIRRYITARSSLVNHIDMADSSVSWKEDQ